MAEQNSIQAQYRGTRGELFPLAIVTALLTLVTLGIYRFWAKTRIRKYLWSSALGDGDAFEYTGTGLEKFLGFLMAIVVLAIYLGVVQMLLFFAGLNFNFNPETTEGLIALNAIIYINLLAVLPLIFYAMYRARRYKMARTRWRGLRFGMEKGAWGYAFRALGLYLLTFLTVGLLLPLATFKLEKYMADRSWYGDARFEQGGHWARLYPAMKHVFFGLAILLLGLGAAAGLQSAGLAVLAILVGYVWLMVGAVYYRIHAMRYLWSHRWLDGEIYFDAQPRTGEIVKIWIVGSILISIFAGVLIFVLGGVLTALFTLGPDVIMAAGLLGIVSYIATLVVIGAMTLIFITQPSIEHFVTTFTLHNKLALDKIRQRAAAEGVDAEGFADALDVGGAF